ncbi:MAG: serine/threonine protein kinase [Deltaproteobacteria bacterium]|nr:serine/threonine protein kinase [Deltaproteobacteria bacterium]
MAEAQGSELPAGMQVLNRYTILGKLAQGGMAEVYLAQQVGPAGYTKIVVIKRVRPHLASDQDFVAMFVNEARLAALINHPNVVQIFDLGQGGEGGEGGEGGKDWFLAMEFLDGRDMLLVGRACRRRNKAVPFDVTARIIADTCHGLEYAHQLAGSDGKTLNLVHRDMSPENILITFEGQVKILDFGIAKARDNAFRTQVGQIKGKLGYVAPEAILGKTLDGRADIFAIGATLYLFLCGRPAFSGSNPLEIFEKSLQTPVRPVKVNTRVPKELDEICMRCLEQDRDKRYQSCGELRQALDDYLAKTGRPLGPPQLAEFMKILFPPDTDEERARIGNFIAGAGALAANGPQASVPQAVPAAVPFTPTKEAEEATQIVPKTRQHSAPPPSLSVEDYQDQTVEVVPSMMSGAPPTALLTATGQVLLDVDLTAVSRTDPFLPPPIDDSGLDIDLNSAAGEAFIIDDQTTTDAEVMALDTSLNANGVAAPFPPPALTVPVPAGPVPAGPASLLAEIPQTEILDDAGVMKKPAKKGPRFIAKTMAFMMGGVFGSVLLVGGLYAAGFLSTLLRIAGIDVELP